MDAFAVALTQGARFRPAWRHTLAIAVTFGLFQGLMPLIGWGIGTAALAYIERFDHWIAFGLLTFIGVQMLRASDEGGDEAVPLSGRALMLAGIATSIDALAAGVTLPTIGIAPLSTCVLLAVVTALLSVAGVRIGAFAGDRFGRPAEILGGLILIALGARILFSHLSA